VKNLIYCIVDNRVYALSLIFLRCIVRYFPDHPDILINTVGLSSTQVNRLLKFEKVNCRNASSPDFEDYPLMWSHATCRNEALYGRFDIWRNGYLCYDNVIYLDVDTIILDSLQSLCNSASFFIARDVHYRGSIAPDYVLTDHNDPKIRSALQQNGIALPQYGGNAGVFVVPRKYRTAHHYEDLVALGKRFKRTLRWADQSLLNLWAAKHSLDFADDYTYNFQTDLIAPGSISYDVKILHLNGMKNSFRFILMWIAYISRPFDRSLYIFSTLCVLLAKINVIITRAQRRMFSPPIQ